TSGSVQPQVSGRARAAEINLDEKYAGSWRLRQRPRQIDGGGGLPALYVGAEKKPRDKRGGGGGRSPPPPRQIDGGGGLPALYVGARHGHDREPRTLVKMLPPVAKGPVLLGLEAGRIEQAHEVLFHPVERAFAFHRARGHGSRPTSGRLLRGE